MDDAALSRTFVLAVLLTGSVRRAEEAMIEAIQSVPCPVGNTDQMLSAVATAAIEMTIEAAPSLVPFLPEELQQVLRLPAIPRRCFALRRLAGLSPQVCAGLLHVDPATVDRLASEAMELLAAPNYRRQFPNPLHPQLPRRITCC
jgi:DNA-directed RNA polymerase specialized sigma24 family protein